MRANQRQLFTAVLAGLRNQPPVVPSLTFAEWRVAGLATGLTALFGELFEGTAALDPLDVATRHHLNEQRQQVRARVERFRPLVQRIADALSAADVPAVFVKGAELIDGVWPYPTARPMADVDVVVPAHLRAQAAAALVAAGCPWWTSTAYEDAFLAWGDGSAGRLDGESAEHNGRVEVHPGWVEFLHGYQVNGFDVFGLAEPLNGRLRLPLAALTAQVVGHLAATVVRGEVRALNVIDVSFCDRRGVDWQQVGGLLATVDARLSAPGLWIVDRLMPGVVPAEVVLLQMQRLPLPARRLLDATEPHQVFRDPAARTTAQWRQGFAMHPRERVEIVGQMIWPDHHRTLRETVRRIAGRGSMGGAAG
jgi:hypothetical protein